MVKNCPTIVEKDLKDFNNAMILKMGTKMAKINDKFGYISELMRDKIKIIISFHE